MIRLILTIFFFLLAPCVKAECIDSVLVKELGMTKVHSTDIAHYYAQERDTSFVHLLDSSLQAHIERLTQIFDYRIEEPITIQIFPEFSFALCVCELDSSKRTALGCTRYRKINLVSPYAKGAQSAYKIQDPKSIVVHEYAHAISFDILGKDYRGKMKPWLREGIAFLCEPDPYYKKNRGAIEWVTESINKDNVPRFRTLENKYTSVKYKGVWAAWLTDFLIFKYGWKPVVNLIVDYGKFPKNFGIRKKQLEKEWVKYMKNKLKLLPTNTKTD